MTKKGTKTNLISKCAKKSVVKIKRHFYKAKIETLCNKQLNMIFCIKKYKHYL